MTGPELDAILQAALSQCEAADCPLSEEQQQIVIRVLKTSILNSAGLIVEIDDSDTENPLDRLTPDERQTLLEFVRQQESQNQPWKITLLNDWLQGKESGAVQFIRERYGMQWFDRVKPVHLAGYEDVVQGDVLKLKVGDRIEVTNGLWEWVQESGPCSREWFPCTVVSVRELGSDVQKRRTSCVIRFDSGAEYEIQGIYDWNRPNWRWMP